MTIKSLTAAMDMLADSRAAVSAQETQARQFAVDALELAALRLRGIARDLARGEITDAEAVFAIERVMDALRAIAGAVAGEE